MLINTFKPIRSGIKLNDFPSLIFCPTVSQNLIHLSRVESRSFKNGKQASNGMKSIQKPASKPAIGHIKIQRIRVQIMDKFLYGLLVFDNNYGLLDLKSRVKIKLFKFLSFIRIFFISTDIDFFGSAMIIRWCYANKIFIQGEFE
ncbi:hypothetical protein BpHYR1_019443 [Brachionus plicatilis]|uniref:Uncharacterized protein n=1 Tax=Brachionus plicatilis TaxID=10195 RepID=A0A3M7RD70_BRAPC|nr:hypothetical protein BpHYR1_019443 [Brachionus plicatilis]